LQQVSEFFLIVPVLLFSMVAHEYAHGYAALRMGDPTARDLGRLTLNPLKHIDPFMSVLLPVVTFFSGSFILGGAKPIPVNPGNYRQLVRGDIIVSLAGVATNLAIAVVCVPLAILLGMLAGLIPAAGDLLAVGQRMLRYGIIINLVLLAFNLIPIPPLDGSHVLKYALPPRLARAYSRIGALGLLVIIGLLALRVPVINWWMTPAVWMDRGLTGLAAHFALPGSGL
jgi:Zn-dependent protease